MTHPPVRDDATRGSSRPVLGFLAFNFFFIRPFGTFRVYAAEDVVVLSVFLGPTRRRSDVRRPLKPTLQRIASSA